MSYFGILTDSLAVSSSNNNLLFAFLTCLQIQANWLSTTEGFSVPIYILRSITTVLPDVLGVRRYLGTQLWVHHLLQIQLCTYRIHCQQPMQLLRRHTFWFILQSDKKNVWSLANRNNRCFFPSSIQMKASSVKLYTLQATTRLFYFPRTINTIWGMALFCWLFRVWDNVCNHKPTLKGDPAASTTATLNLPKTSNETKKPKWWMCLSVSLI